MSKKNDTIRYYEYPWEDGDKISGKGPSSMLTDDEYRQIEHVNQKIASMDDLKKTMEFLFRETQSLLPCDRIGIAFFEEDGERLNLYHVIANYSPLYIGEGYSADISRSSLKKIFQNVTPRIINNVDRYAGENPSSESTQLLQKEGVKSSMTCPLSVEGRPVGLLFRSSRRENVYGEKEILIHLLIAERLSQAVEKAYRIEELTTAINSYMEMLGFVTHELKSPLDSIITLGKTLIAGYLGDMSEKHKDYVQRMVNKAEYLSNITNDYLNLARFEGGNVRFNASEVEFIESIVKESLDIILPQARQKGLTIEENYTPEKISVTCDANQMKIVVVNLLSNAVKYSDDHGAIKVTCALEKGSVLLSIWNQGPGFSSEEKTRLFRKFSRIENEELLKRKGSGIGLYTSWKIIHLHNGSITADSEQGKWAEFSFSIPENRTS